MSADAARAVAQAKGALLPFTASKPTTELVKISKDMKVRLHSAHDAIAFVCSSLAIRAFFSVSFHCFNTVLVNNYVCFSVSVSELTRRRSLF